MLAFYAGSEVPETDAGSKVGLLAKWVDTVNEVVHHRREARLRLHPFDPGADRHGEATRDRGPLALFHALILNDDERVAVAGGKADNAVVSHHHASNLAIRHAVIIVRRGRKVKQSPDQAVTSTTRHVLGALLAGGDEVDEEKPFAVGRDILRLFDARSLVCEVAHAGGEPEPRGAGLRQQRRNRRAQLLQLGAGAGIVADSVPALEWEETENKARAMLTAIGRVRGQR